MADTNLRQILSEVKSVTKTTDKVILETEKNGTVTTELGNIIFNKNNFEVAQDLDTNTLLVGSIGDEMFKYVDSRVNTIIIPEILALNFKSFTNSSGIQIGTNNIATTNLSLKHFHVNTIRPRESVKLEYSKNASGLEDSLRDSGIDLSPGIYKVECVGSFTLAGPAGGFLINGESFGNGDRGYLSLELYNDTSPNEPLLVSTPIINFAPLLSETEPPSSWCGTTEEWSRLARNFYISPGTQNAYMYGFISVCQPSNIKLKAHTAGSYLIGYPFPDNTKDLPPAMYSPIQIIFEKITDNPFEFRIFGPEVNILTRIPQIRTTPPPILTTTLRPGTTTTTTTIFPSPTPSSSPIPTPSNTPSNTPTPVASSGPSVTPTPTPTPTPAPSQSRRPPDPSPTITVVPPLPSASPRINPTPTPSLNPPRAGEWSRTSAGSYVFTVPNNVNYISMVAVGGGGGGAAGNDKATSGGNGGDLRWRNNYPVRPGTKISVTVGEGGSSKQAGIDDRENNGGPGGDTIIKYAGNIILRAAGGNEGRIGNNIPTPNTGSTSTASEAIGGGNGGRGGRGIVLSDHDASTGGGGGGAGGYLGPGGDGGSWGYVYVKSLGKNVLSAGQGENGAGGGGGGGSTGGSAGKGGGGGGGVGLDGIKAGGNGQGGRIANRGENGNPGGVGSPSGISQASRSPDGFGKRCGGGGGGKGEVMGGPRGQYNLEHGSDGGVRIIWGASPSGALKTFPYNAIV